MSKVPVELMDLIVHTKGNLPHLILHLSIEALESLCALIYNIKHSALPMHLKKKERLKAILKHRDFGSILKKHCPPALKKKSLLRQSSNLRTILRVASPYIKRLLKKKHGPKEKK